MRILARYTPARHQWLAAVARDPRANRETNTGCLCMRLGWTEWILFKRRVKGERLTEVGRALLFYWNHQHNGEPNGRSR
jgi:hypothetical protein